MALINLDTYKDCLITNDPQLLISTVVLIIVNKTILKDTR